MDKYTILCTELRGSAQSLNGNIETLQKKADKLQKAINKVTLGDYKASDLSSAYTSQTALAGSITRLGKICGAMNTAALRFSEASAELSGRANLTAYYMQHTDTLDYNTLMATYSAAIASAGSAAAGYEVVKDALKNSGYSVGSLGSISNVINTIHEVPAYTYAELCYIAYDAAKNETDPSAAFVRKIRNSDYIPENSRLKHISEDQVSYYESSTGFSCFVITDGDTAIIVFLGTNDVVDVGADFLLAFGGTPEQTREARDLTEIISKQYQNVVVTGHSLGGHLATDVTLNNNKVDQCVAFEAPDRWDHLYQKTFNKKQASKITTYNAEGSIISTAVPGDTTGKEVMVDVDPNGKMIIDRNHGIKELRNELFRRRGRGYSSGGGGYSSGGGGNGAFGGGGSQGGGGFR